MEGVEIVITPRIIERVIFSTIIIVLLVLLVMKWDCGACDSNDLTASVIQENITNATNTTEIVQAVAPASTALLTPCENNIKDAGETDIDCGGTCGACKEFQTCNLDIDCQTGLYCFQHIKCLKPSCEDGIKNQDETQIDCGGLCKGYYWASDNKCHANVEPSGELALEVEADISRSPNSGNAIVNSVTLNFDNGLGKQASVTGQIFVRDVGGSTLGQFESRDGDEEPLDDFTITLKDAETKTLKIDFEATNNTMRTLAGIKSSEEFEIFVVLKDSVKKTILNEITWVNTQ